MLLQESPETLQREPFAFKAKILRAPELKYSVTEKECLAVVHALRTWRHYVQGEELSAHMDHMAQVWLMDSAQLHGRLVDLDHPGHPVHHRSPHGCVTGRH